MKESPDKNDAPVEENASLRATIGKEKIRIIIFFTSLTVMVFGYLGYTFFFGQAVQERLQTGESKAPQEIPAPSPIDEQEQERRAAEQEREIARAIYQADIYQWKIWRHTLLDIAENKKTMARKIEIAEAEAAAERRKEAAENARKRKLEEEKAKQAMSKIAPRKSVIKRGLRSFGN